MRAKKGTRMATATELLLVEPLVSGSVSVTFSLTLKPATWQTQHLTRGNEKQRLYAGYALEKKCKEQNRETKNQNDTYLLVVMTTMMKIIKLELETQQPDDIHNDHSDDDHCDCYNLLETII